MNSIQKGDAALVTVDTKAAEMAVATDSCERGFAHLGYLLLEVAEMQYWRVKFDTFQEYLKSVGKAAKKTPGELQKYFLTVRDLIDTFTPDQLEQMGITKAIKLRNTKDYAIVLPQAVIDAALDPEVTVKDLKEVVARVLKMPEDEKAEYIDLEFEFLATPERKAFVEQVLYAVDHTEPFPKKTISAAEQAWQRFEKMGMEFLSSHSGDGQ